MVALVKIVSQQVSAFLGRKFYVRIEKQGGQIILWQAGAQSLEIDQVSLFVPDDDILRLKIAVDQNPPIRSQSFGQIFERGVFPEPFYFGRRNLKIEAETVFQAVILFPAIKRLVEFWLQMQF